MCLIDRCQSRGGKREFGYQQFGHAKSPRRVHRLTGRRCSAGKSDASPKEGFHPLQYGLGIKPPISVLAEDKTGPARLK